MHSQIHNAYCLEYMKRCNVDEICYIHVFEFKIDICYLIIDSFELVFWKDYLREKRTENI